MLTLRIETKGNVDKEGRREIRTEVYENVYSFTRDSVNTCVVYGPLTKLGSRSFSIWENDLVFRFELKEKEEHKNAETS